LAYSRDGRRQFGYVENREVALNVLPQAIITARRFVEPTRFTGAVYDNQGMLVTSSLGFNEGEFAPLDPPSIDPTAFAAAHRLETALYGGTLFPIMGHFLFETVARLWPLVDLKPDREVSSSGTKIVFHPWLELELRSFLSNPLYKRIFEVLGIQERSIVLADRDLRIELLHYPCTLSVYHRFMHPLLGRVLDRIGDALARDASPFGRFKGRRAPSRRIFLSRSRWAVHRRVKNETLLDELFAQHGFEIIHPQRIQPGPLVRALREADVVASTDGSQAHLAAFCKPGTSTLLLDTRPVPTQFAIGVLRDLNAIHLPLYANELWNRTTGEVEISPRFNALVETAMTHLSEQRSPQAPQLRV
jgi:hypothetical protein